MQFEFLADNPHRVPQVISWWLTIWADRMGSDVKAMEEQLLSSLSKDQYPVHILALKNGEPIGTATLKMHELNEMFPDKQYWVGSVFVEAAHRGDKVATALTQEIIALARDRGLPHLYLQTSNLSGGLYAKLGWQPLQRFTYRGEETLLMRKLL